MTTTTIIDKFDKDSYRVLTDEEVLSEALLSDSQTYEDYLLNNLIYEN